jgi:hypothetical protein
MPVILPVRLLREWLDATGIVDGALFWSVPKSGSAARLGRALRFQVQHRRLGEDEAAQLRRRRDRSETAGRDPARPDPARTKPELLRQSAKLG